MAKFSDFLCLICFRFYFYLCEVCIFSFKNYLILMQNEHEHAFINRKTDSIKK